MSPLWSLLGCSRLCLPTLLQFLDQENQMCRKQLEEVEARLNSTMATLQEQVLRHEELMESHQHLRYCPMHQLHTNPSGFGTSNPFWGVRGDILTMVTAVPAKCGGPGGGERLWARPADPILRQAAKICEIYTIASERQVCPHPTLRKGNAAPAEADAIPQGRAGCPQQGAGQHQGRAPQLADKEEQSFLVFHGHYGEQDAVAGAR